MRARAVAGLVMLLLLLLRKRVALDAALVKFCILNGQARQRGAGLHEDGV